MEESEQVKLPPRDKLIPIIDKDSISSSARPTKRILPKPPPSLNESSSFKDNQQSDKPAKITGLKQITIGPEIAPSTWNVEQPSSKMKLGEADPTSNDIPPEPPPFEVSLDENNSSNALHDWGRNPNPKIVTEHRSWFRRSWQSRPDLPDPCRTALVGQQKKCDASKLGALVSNGNLGKTRA